MEEYQPFHHGPHHPEVFLRRLVGLLVDDRSGRLVGLYIVSLHDLLPEYFVKWLQEFHRLLEPAVHSAFRQALHAKMGVLLDLTVIRHVVLILLEQDLTEQAGTGDAFIYRQHGHGGNQHAAQALWSDGCVVLQAPLLTDNLLDVKLAGLMLHDTCHLLSDLLIEIPVEIIRREDYLFQYREVLHHDAVLPLLAAFLLGLYDSLHSRVTGIGNLLSILRKHAGKEVKLTGIDNRKLLRLAAKELAVQPCDLCRQLLDAGLQGINL